MKVPCPGCGTMLEVTDSGCQLCLRGRSKGEILRDIQKFKAAEKAAKQRPWKILAALILTAAAGNLFWTKRADLSAAAAAARAKASQVLDSATDPKNLYPQPTAPAPAPSPSSPASAPGPAPASTPGPTPMAPTITAAPAKPAPPPSWDLPRAKLSTEQWSWLVRGFVYDLSAVRPVAGAEIVFRERTGNSTLFQTTSDPTGYYELRVGKRSDYLVEVRAPGFRAAPLEESDPPYRAQSKAARAKALSEARGYTSDSALIGWNENIEEVRQDLVLVPSP